MRTFYNYSYIEGVVPNPYSFEENNSYIDYTIEQKSQWMNNFKSLLACITSNSFENTYTSILKDFKDMNFSDTGSNFIKDHKKLLWINSFDFIKEEKGELLEYISKFENKMTFDHYGWLYKQLIYYMCGKLESEKVDLFKEIGILKNTPKLTFDEQKIYDKIFANIDSKDRMYKHAKYMVDKYYNHTENSKFDLSDYIQECLCILLEYKKENRNFLTQQAMSRYVYKFLFDNLYSVNLTTNTHIIDNGTYSGFEFKTLTDFESLENIKNDQKYVISEKEAFSNFYKKDLNEFLISKMKVLTEKEKYVLIKTNDLDDHFETMEELSKKYGVTYERIRQIENKSKRKLYRRMRVIFEQEGKFILD